MKQDRGRLATVKQWRVMRPAILVTRPVRRALRRALARVDDRVKYAWGPRLGGRQPIPPPHAYKVSVVREYASRFGTRTLVETGTYLGEMVEATRSAFQRIWSIELDDALYDAATRRFQPYAHITIVHGDSSTALPEVLRTESGPILFWLDGHWSGGITARGSLDTPVLAELAAILARGGDKDVILIDDAREFGRGDYPRTDAIAELIASRHPGWHFEVRDDIMRAHAAGTGPHAVTAAIPAGQSETR